VGFFVERKNEKMIGYVVKEEFMYDVVCKMETWR